MLEISIDDVIASMRRDNPWWDGRPSPEVADLTKKRAYFQGFKELALDWDVRRSVILMGPRRVGKTVMLHQFVMECVADGFSPKCILFASLDTPLYSGLSLDRLVQLFENHTDHDPDGKRIVIFDEVQYLKDWEVHLKVLTDRYPRTRFVASGSAAAALRLKSRESGAGRFTDYYLPPLTFAEFLAFSDLEDELVEPYTTGKKARYRSRDIKRLNQEFVNYLNFGGYPESVMSPKVRSDLQRYLGRDIVDKVLLRDLPNLYGIQNIQELNRLFTTIAYHSGQEISLDGLASTSGVAKNTIGRYLEYLEAAFLIVRVWRVDESGRTFQRMRNFKVYLTNPSMRAALFGPLTGDHEAMGAMAETAIFSQWFHSEALRFIHYARWKKGRKTREVDMVMLDPATLKPLWAYEIKWSDRCVGRPEELAGLLEFAKKNRLFGLFVGATTLTEEADTDFDGVTIRQKPCALHCYGVGRNLTERRPV